MADLLDEVRLATRSLAELARTEVSLPPKLATALRATCDDVTARLAATELFVLVVGSGDPSKRVLFNTAAGESLFVPGAREPMAVVLLRHAEDARCVVELAEGGTRELASPLRTKFEIVDGELTRAERERTTAVKRRDELIERRGELERAKTAAMSAAEPATLILRSRATIGAVLQRLLAWVLALVAIARGRRPSKEPAKDKDPREKTVAMPVLEAASLPDEQRRGELLRIERELLDLEPQIAKIESDARRAKEEQAEVAAERRRVLLNDVRTLTDEDKRGPEIVELRVEYPCALLPSGLALVDAPALTRADDEQRKNTWLRLRDEIGGCIVVSPSGRTGLLAPDLLQRLEPVLPYGIRGSATADEAGARELAARLREELPSLFQRLREESPTVVAARITRIVHDRLESLTTACSKALEELEQQIVVLEAETIPSASIFRARTLERMRPLVEEAARRTIARLREILRKRIAELGGEWRSAITSANSRADVSARISAINENAEKDIKRICAELDEVLLAEVQRTTDTLGTWVLDEVSVAYKTLSLGDEAAPIVLSDVALSPSDSVGGPLAATMAVFEKKRVGIGLGGAAAGAALGTIIFPGIGTAVGAMVGVLAGLVEGTESLKRQALERLREYLSAVEVEIAKRLDDGVTDLGRDIGIAVDETLDGALARRANAIARLVDEHAKAIVRERRKRTDLVRMRDLLVEQEARFGRLASATANALQELAARRSHS